MLTGFGLYRQVVLVAGSTVYDPKEISQQKVVTHCEPVLLL